MKKPVIIQEKKKIIETFAVHAKDTGSAQVQIAILTSRIDSLQSHLKGHPKDNHSRKGLLAMVGKRRKHLDYLKNRKADDYEKVIKDLGLRK
ncbi:MAG: 30S ribosomal protein S15 [Candidatus Gracilibacteria bacterium]|nr:30S ribosomal protein S15 [Candidatus Gracilibacteria bacterium]